MSVDETTAAAGERGEADEASPAGTGRRISRRQLLLGAAGGAAVLGIGGVAGYEWPHGAPPRPKPTPDLGVDLADQVESFVSRPDLHPPRIRVTDHLSAPQRAADAGRHRFIFLSPRHTKQAPSQQGLMIVDRRGRLVWFQPTPGKDPFDLNAQTYEGKPVLTWWQGKVVAAHGVGEGEMADSSYKHLTTIQAGHGLREDLHELNLTSAGTALITAYGEETTNLSSIGGARRGKVFTGHAQEIDLRTGKVLFDWNSLEHIGVAETYSHPPKKGSTPFDYFHINSISETPDGNLLISARNTWALYKVDRSTGAVIWRMNGKRSDFTMGPGAHFYWQHDSRLLSTKVLTVFDDGAFPAEEKQSRGLLLAVDEAKRHVSLTRAYLNPAGFIAANQGSVQLLPGGGVFVGWGNQPYFSEFDAGGRLVLDGEFPVAVRSYRAYTHDWNGSPTEPPRAAARPDPAGGTLVYASWNGSTATEGWQVLAGAHASALEPIGRQDKAGFETAIAVNTSHEYFQAIALDSSGNELARSGVVRRGGPPG